MPRRIAHAEIFGKGVVRRTLTVKGPLRITATLRYRSAPQDVMDELFGKGRFTIEAVEMAVAEDRVTTSTP